MGHPSGAFRRHRIDTETAFGASLRVRANEALTHSMEDH